jgi:hypothetical protein
MTPDDIIASVRERGATVEAVGGQLRVRAPRPLPDHVMMALRGQKAELIAVLSKSANSNGPEGAAPKVLTPSTLCRGEHLSTLAEPRRNPQVSSDEKGPKTPHLAKVLTPQRVDTLTGDTGPEPSMRPPVDPDYADDAWSERAAIAEYAGGLSRADAEALADAEHPPDPTSGLPEEWTEWFHAEVRARSRRMPRAEAQRRVWGLAVSVWHHHHGARPDGHQCAGCGAPLGGRAMVLPDGARVHDDARMLDCLSTHGQRWRPVAAAALEGLGIEPPETLG